MPAPQSDRRQLLRAGVWAVPVVSVAAAAPAFAASAANLSTSTMTVPNVSGSGVNRLVTFSVTIINSGTAQTSQLQVRITFSGTAPAGQTPPDGFTVAVDPLNPNVLVYTSLTQLNGGESRTVNFQIRPGNNSTSGTVAVTPGNGTGRTFPSTTF